MPNQRDIEQLLRNIPIETTGRQNTATDILTTFVALRNAAFEGIEYAGQRIAIPGTTTAFSIPSLISDWRDGKFPEVAVTLIGRFTAPTPDVQQHQHQKRPEEP